MTEYRIDGHPTTTLSCFDCGRATKAVMSIVPAITGTVVTWICTACLAARINAGSLVLSDPVQVPAPAPDLTGIEVQW